MKKRLICGFILVVGGLSGFCLGQTGKKVQGDTRARAEALVRSCSAEFDDPASPEYKQCTEAIQLLEQLKAKQPQDVSILLALGRAYANRSEEKSVDAYQAALALDPTNVTANFALGLMLHAPDEQIPHLRAVIAQEANHPEAHGRLAELLATTSQNDEAVAQVKQQIAIDPNRIDVIANVMQTLAAKGNRSAAGQVCVSYLKSALPAKVKCEDSRSMIGPYADQAEVAAAFKEQCQGYALYDDALRQKEPHERARLLEEAIKSGNPDARAHGELALTYLQMNQVDRAMSEMTEQIKLNPLVSHEQMASFAKGLRQRALINDEIKIFQAYLVSQAPKEVVCESVHKMLVESESKYRALKASYQKRCGTWTDK